jgi:hypothetical protein
MVAMTEVSRVPSEFPKLKYEAYFVLSAGHTATIVPSASWPPAALCYVGTSQRNRRERGWHGFTKLARLADAIVASAIAP